MDNETLRDTISKFSGNIESSFYFLEVIHGHLNFDLDINFNTSNSLQKYINMVRNMISRGLVRKPRKSGRTLILDERSFLDFLVARKYLGAGCTMDCVSGYLLEMSLDDIYDRLFVKQLPDIEIVTGRSFAYCRAESNTPKLTFSKNSRKLFYNIKIVTGLNLLVEQGRFSEAKLAEMTTYIEKFVIENR